MYEHTALLSSVRGRLSRNPCSTLAEIASSLGVSRRTLERCLVANGVRFRDVRDEILLGRVRSLLASSPRSKKETAYALGFSSPSAFCQ